MGKTCCLLGVLWHSEVVTAGNVALATLGRRNHSFAAWLNGECGLHAWAGAPLGGFLCRYQGRTSRNGSCPPPFARWKAVLLGLLCTVMCFLYFFFSSPLLISLL